jgi:malate dehydrogenase
LVDYTEFIIIFLTTDPLLLTEPGTEMDKSILVSRIQALGRHFPHPPLNLEANPIRVAVTGAAGQIGSFLCHFIAQGRMFGPY